MTPAPEGGREAGPKPNGKLSERASGRDVAPIALAIGFPDTPDPAHRFMQWYNPTHWFWWGRGLGVFIGILVREREAEVRAATDRAWEAKVREAARAERLVCTEDCYDFDNNDSRFKRCDCDHYNAALSALLARLGVTEEG